MAVLMDMMNGSARGAGNTPAGHFTPAFREASMQTQSTSARVDRRSQLREIVERLGQAANPAAIRQEAYPVSEFGKKDGDAELYRSYCKTCMNQSRAEHQLQALLNRFGLTRNDYDSLLVVQNGMCAICQRPGQGKGSRWQTLVFDHCRSTGKFRGLLRDKCNLGIGNFDDDIERLEASAAYLRRCQAANL